MWRFYTASGTVVNDLLLIVTPMVGFCNVFFVLLCVTLCPFFCNHLDGEERAGCFALFVFLVFFDCCVALDDCKTRMWLFLTMPWVCDCGIS